MSNIKILPCPCCNSEIKGGVRLTGYCNTNIQYIQCDCCGLKMETKYIIDDISQTALKAITMELIQKWNTRKPIDNIVAELEEVRKECVKMQKTTTDAYGYMKMKKGIDIALYTIREGDANER